MLRWFSSFGSLRDGGEIDYLNDQNLCWQMTVQPSFPGSAWECMSQGPAFFRPVTVGWAVPTNLGRCLNKGVNHKMKDAKASTITTPPYFPSFIEPRKVLPSIIVHPLP